MIGRFGHSHCPSAGPMVSNRISISIQWNCSELFANLSPVVVAHMRSQSEATHDVRNGGITGRLSTPPSDAIG